MREWVVIPPASTSADFVLLLITDGWDAMLQGLTNSYSYLNICFFFSLEKISFQFYVTNY